MRSMNMLSRQHLFPSMLMAICSRDSAAVNAELVNCKPWLKLKAAHRPWRASDSYSVSNSECGID